MKTEEELAKLEKEKLEKLEVISLLEGFCISRRICFPQSITNIYMIFNTK